MLTRLVLITAAVMAMSSAAHAKVLSKVKFKGAQVFTFFDGSADLDCGGDVAGSFFVSGSINGSDSVTKIKGSTKTAFNSATISAVFFNSCTGEFRFIDGLSSGGVDSPSQNLRSASIDTAFLAQDFGDLTLIPVDLDLEFQGFGEISKGKFVDHTKTLNTPDGPAMIIHSISSNANRSATVTGTMTIAGITLTSLNAQGILNLNANSSLVIEK